LLPSSLPSAPATLPLLPLLLCSCRLLKRLRDEEGSRFQGQPLLHQRYVLLALLGRGGFSEVHKAYDLASLKFVAVKVGGVLGRAGVCAVSAADGALVLRESPSVRRTKPAT
jgi:hypothetical protein